jgi:Mrp family chromosome partitioning ATPase
MKLKMIQIESQIAMLTKRKADYEKQAESLKEEITGISEHQLDEVEHQLEEAEKLNDTLAAEREALDQLVKSQLLEWTVSVPASMDTTKVGSSSAKLFVVTFALCALVLSAPLMVAEWRAQTGTPQVQFARSLRVPVLAERVLEDFSPQQRRHNAEQRLTIEQTEALRMLTLRIQQSCHRPGSVVLFSSLDSQFSAAPLMATVAECLAEREERVLLVDAVSPDRALMPVINVLPGSNGASPLANGKAKQSKKPAVAAPVKEAKPSAGLSEYLAEECEEIGDLIRPTSCPGVDLIASGRNGFPREAMASSCLTELLNACRRNYTMVLVHGPAVDCAADLQMLTARADGIVLAATSSIGKEPRARAFVQDLLDLGAPIIGLVA